MHDGIVVYPTDTLYGLGGDALSDEAIMKVFEAKGREYHKPISIAVSDPDMIRAVACVDELAEEFIDQFLPGPVTVILPARTILSSWLTAGTKKIGIRYPNHEIALELISRFDSPITATSANLSGGPDPVSLDLCTVPYDCAINAGPLSGIPSTVVDLELREIIRAGAEIDAVAAFLAQWS
ncbi:MAG TPA: L-threonylcarbamoyladenylate synthase [Methanospirillum sp.]|uniref:L-threonylcarbamoyladenylate synthase n=1 Tax=Methanospirillum sp. TaxID=45200 RepID=UPI002C51B6C9|nr:L-threonylcarbamoyladenylate synthase [Methanospirillum sp.]HOJ95267.1 L-threonylcarbamoyladenylate synthase [Methanospirillum sp.]HOL40863.1 L-threonylcarbamoyladenylate synthase [Methanospirillum sp.]HPP78923.1 L-threonylcarbamoyladenylate synthase [Methanospirillum sp.]